MTTEFRPLNQREKNVIFAAADKNRIPADDPRLSNYNSLQVSYERMQGGFAVCVLVLDSGTGLKEDPTKTLIWRGVSRRSYKDKANPVRGEMLAFSRAILYGRAVTLDGSVSEESKDGEEEYFLVLSLDGDAPCTIESAQVVEVFSNRENAELYIVERQSDTQRRLEILAVRI